MVKNPPASAEPKRRRLHPWVGRVPWRRTWQPTLVFCGLQSIGLQRVGHDWARTHGGLLLKAILQDGGLSGMILSQSVWRCVRSPRGNSFISTCKAVVSEFSYFPWTCYGQCTATLQSSREWVCQSLAVTEELGFCSQIEDSPSTSLPLELRGSRTPVSPLTMHMQQAEKKKKDISRLPSLELSILSPFLACWVSVSCGWIFCTFHFPASSKAKIELCLGFSVHVCSVVSDSFWPHGL